MDAKRLRQLLRYDPATGEFVWIAEKRPGVPSDRMAGCVHARGYVHIVVDRRQYKAHRLAFLYMTGRWPKDQVDHINMVRTDNRWANLREATQSLNQQNQRKARGEVGVLGVSRNGSGFVAKIHIGGSQRYLGTFRTPEAAGAAYLVAKRKFHEGCTL